MSGFEVVDGLFLVIWYMVGSTTTSLQGRAGRAGQRTAKGKARKDRQGIAISKFQNSFFLPEMGENSYVTIGANARRN